VVGAVEIDQGAKVVMGAMSGLTTEHGTITNAGTFDVQAGTSRKYLSGPFTNTGTFSDEGDLQALGTPWQTSGTMTVASGATFKLYPTVATNIFKLGGGKITNNGAFIVVQNNQFI